MKVVFVGGGTGGAIMPLLAVAARLRRTQDIRCLFVVTRQGIDRALVTQAGYSAHPIRAGKFRRYFHWKNFTDLFLIAFAFFHSLRFLKKMRPACVVSAGGYLSVPVAWAAMIFRIPLIVHQQDIQPGLANRLITPFAMRITVSVKSQLGMFPVKKTSWTGNPVRRYLFKGNPQRAYARFSFRPYKPILLVLGGSTGAAALNEAIRLASTQLVEQIQIIHIVGDRGKAQTLHDGMYHAVEFLDDLLPDVYAAATLVCTRAGMSTLSEIAVLGKAAIIVPMPDTHQEVNASYFQSAHAASVIWQKELTSEKIVQVISDLLTHRDKRQRMEESIRSLMVADADDKIAQEIRIITKQKK